MKSILSFTLGAIIIATLPVALAAKAPTNDPVLYQEMLNCKLAGEASEVPKSLEIFVSDPEFRGSSKGIMTMKMENVHVPGAVTSVAVLIDVSAKGDRVKGTVSKDWDLSFNSKELTEYMLDRGPEFEAALKVPARKDPLKYTCTTLNRR
ncbi:MAG: hypothetical protein AB1540_05170 [Bdellovibrionota bacterium]